MVPEVDTAAVEATEVLVEATVVVLVAALAVQVVTTLVASTQTTLPAHHQEQTRSKLAPKYTNT